MFKSVIYQCFRSSTLCSPATLLSVRGYARRGHSPFQKPTEFEELNEYDVADESEIISDLDQIEDELLRSKADRAREEKEERLQLKRKILQRKYFKKAPELNLLSWNAKQQIRYLNAEYPFDWTVTRLAKSFPVSEEGIIAILKSSYVPKQQQEIMSHDKRVRKNWLAVRSYLKENNNSFEDIEGGPVAESVRHLTSSYKLPLVINASGIDNVVVPERITLQTHQKKLGLFESIVKDSKATRQPCFQFAKPFSNDKSLLAEISIMGTRKTNSVRDRTKEEHTTEAQNPSRRQKRLAQTLGSGNMELISLSDSQLEQLSMFETGPIDSVRQERRNSCWSEIESEWKTDQHEKNTPKRDSRNSKLQHNKMERCHGQSYNPSVFKKNSSTYREDVHEKDICVYDDDGEFLYKKP